MSGEIKKIKKKMWAMKAVTVWLLAIGFVTASNDIIVWWTNPVLNCLTIWATAIFGGWLLHSWLSGQLFGPRMVREQYAYQLLNSDGQPATGVDKYLNSGIFFEVDDLYIFSSFLNKEGVDTSQHKIKVVRVQWPSDQDLELCRDDLLKEQKT